MSQISYLLSSVNIQEIKILSPMVETDAVHLLLAFGTVMIIIIIIITILKMIMYIYIYIYIYNNIGNDDSNNTIIIITTTTMMII